MNPKIEVTVESVHDVLRQPPASLARLLPEVFEKLLQPAKQTHRFMEVYTTTIYERIASDTRDRGKEGYDWFEKACVQAGITKCMISVATQTHNHSRVAAFRALQVLEVLNRVASVPERRTILKDFLDEKFVDCLLEMIRGHEYGIQRHAALSTLSAYTGESFLAEHLSAKKTAEVIITALKYAVVGYESVKKELGDPTTAWQSRLTFGDGQNEIPCHIALRHAPRWYSRGCENALYLVQALFIRQEKPEKRFILDVIKAEPEMVDILLEVVSQPRTPWHPESHTQETACECLVALFSFPTNIVPGIPFNCSEAPQDKVAKEEWEQTLCALEILASRQGFREGILRVFKLLDEEEPELVLRLTERVSQDYYAEVCPHDNEMVKQIWFDRGMSRICMLRLIINLTYVERLPTTYILSFLRLAYTSSMRVKPLLELEAGDLGAIADHVERTAQIARIPTWAAYTGTQVDSTLQVACQSILGPTAYLRLLTVLARRGILDDIPHWTLDQVPEGIDPATNLTQLRQITDPAILKKLMGFITKRASMQREEGGLLFRKEDWDAARVQYTAASEALVALLSLEEEGKGKWKGTLKGARSELVMNLGNSSETCTRLNQERAAYGFAAAAVQFASTAPMYDPVKSELLEKNKRRAVKAMPALTISR